VPVLLHQGLTEEEICRRADVDNENDEYHVEVPLLDVWAEYHRLKYEEWDDETGEKGWSLARIGRAKHEHGKPVDDSTVCDRIRMHKYLPKVARKAVWDGLFDEGHAKAVIGLTWDVPSLNPWLTTEQAQAELVKEVLSKHRGSSAKIKPTVQNVRAAARRCWHSTWPRRRGRRGAFGRFCRFLLLSAASCHF
jgi:hypothetical protein